ncbi:MAG TPA: hypothetical protein DDW52_22435 [Planctomycetaceae bacterium]|nr:hypothetical protein [Planctomycetaceae bacterium]
MRTFLNRSVCLLLALLAGCGYEIQSPTRPIPAPPPAPAPATSATILAWNIESGGSDSEVILRQLREDMPKASIIALSEVPPEDIETFASFFPDGGGVTCDGKGSDRLTIAWNASYDLVRRVRVDEAEFAPGYHRAPLIVHLRHKDSGEEFLLMNNLDEFN